MESNFNTRDFEQFVKQNADQYRMFPSEKVWKGIDNALHTRRKWYGLGLGLLLLMTGSGVALVMMTSPGSKTQPVTTGITIQGKTTSSPATPSSGSAGDIKAAKKTGQPVVYKNTNASSLTSALDFQPVLNTTSGRPAEETTAGPAQPFIPAATAQPLASEERIEVSMVNPSTRTLRPVSTPLVNASNVVPGAVSALNIHVAGDPVLNSILNTDKSEASEKQTARIKDIPAELLNPFTIESVVNSYKKPAPRKRIDFQLYFSPTISYRKLSDNKEFLTAVRNTTNPYPAGTDVNNFVSHKPNLGLEFGAAARYPLTKRLTVRAGLQFNVSRYDIKAVKNQQAEVATIDLNAGNNNTISTITRYRNYDGVRLNWLQNLYYTASAPIGLELKVLGDKKTSFGIASTIQPTFIISDNAYLLSSDFKNYAEVPSLIRRWNMNTSFEAFVGYSTGTVRWHVGPQVRYQIRSSFKNQYPVKENLIDVGLKVALMFNQ